MVNTASRARSAAEAGQILVTPTVYERAGAEMAGSEAREYRLKGFEGAMELYAA